MSEMRFMISDAAKKIDVEPHVLRYWEEELEVDIPRNEMGHRYYTADNIDMMLGVKYLKEKGFQLKSIKILLPDMDQVLKMETRRLLELRDKLELAVSREELRVQREAELADYEPKQEKGILSGSAENALSCKKENEIKEELSDGTDKIHQFRILMGQIVMDAMKENNHQLAGEITDSVSREIAYHARRKELADEEHYKQLDRVLREYQSGQKQAAVARECGEKKRESKFFKKNGKVKI